MITAKAFAGKHYAVYGLARSGLATAEAFLASGAKVTAWDAKEEARAKAPAGTEIANLDEADLAQFDSLVVTPGLPLNRHPIAQRARDAGVEIIGAGLAFLWFNAPPAAVFMGDTGSLALGGALGAVSVATHHEFVLVIVGGLFVLEALSVVIQVAVYKRTGKRVFLMAPIHHHFEHLGWSEPTVVIRFWIVSFVLALAGLSTLKLR